MGLEDIVKGKRQRGFSWKGKKVREASNRKKKLCKVLVFILNGELLENNILGD